MKTSFFLSIVSAAMFAACTTVPSPEVELTEGFDHPAWKGEKIHAVALIKSGADIEGATLEVVGSKCISADFVYYVTGDVLDDKKFGQCGKRNPGEFDSIYVADRIGPEKITDIKAGTPQPVWISVNVPSDAGAGEYKGTLKIKAKGMKVIKLPFSYSVVDETLPSPKDWAFHLDLWQNPYSVARYFNVPQWSEEHFARMKPVFERLAAAGQKVVTATVIDRPWNGQTEDPFGSMVVKTLSKDGTWSYDYSVFDRWVEFMFSLGIDSQINCYSLIPWKLSFDYVDGESGEVKTFEAAPGTKEYGNYWGEFVSDFASHLREKGWFEKTMLAMDERPREAMSACIELIHGIEPEMKFSLAGNYHEDIEFLFSDLCISSVDNFPEEAVAARREAGLVSTYYTCCAEKYPNSFIASNPKEAAWFGWYALANNFDGYLRWAYNSWTIDPNNDARFRTWPAGDCYMVYPEASSVRFENLVEGVQDYEKARILRERWISEGDTTRLNALEEALSRFTMSEISQNGPEPALGAARAILFE